MCLNKKTKKYWKNKSDKNQDKRETFEKDIKVLIINI